MPALRGNLATLVNCLQGKPAGKQTVISASLRKEVMQSRYFRRTVRSQSHVHSFSWSWA